MSLQDYNYLVGNGQERGADKHQGTERKSNQPFDQGPHPTFSECLENENLLWEA